MSKIIRGETRTELKWHEEKEVDSVFVKARKFNFGWPNLFIYYSVINVQKSSTFNRYLPCTWGQLSQVTEYANLPFEEGEMTQKVRGAKSETIDRRATESHGASQEGLPWS